MIVAGGADQVICAPEMVSCPGCQQVDPSSGACADAGEIAANGANRAMKMASAIAMRRRVFIYAFPVDQNANAPHSRMPGKPGCGNWLARAVSIDVGR